MRRLAILALGLSSFGCNPVLAQPKVEELVEPRAVCIDRELVERHVRFIGEDKNYDRANKEFLAAAQEGQCVGLPVGARIPISEVGITTGPFVDKDGDLVRITAIRLHKYWTLYLELLQVGKKT